MMLALGVVSTVPVGVLVVVPVVVPMVIPVVIPMVIPIIILNDSGDDSVVVVMVLIGAVKGPRYP
jgi:hypothetical protein